MLEFESRKIFRHREFFYIVPGLRSSTKGGEMYAQIHLPLSGISGMNQSEISYGQLARTNEESSDEHSPHL